MWCKNTEIWATPLNGELMAFQETQWRKLMSSKSYFQGRKHFKHTRMFYIVNKIQETKEGLHEVFPLYWHLIVEQLSLFLSE